MKISVHRYKFQKLNRFYSLRAFNFYFIINWFSLLGPYCVQIYNSIDRGNIHLLGVVVILTKLLQFLCNCCHHTFNICYCSLEIYGILQLLRFFRGVPHSIDFDHYVKCGDCVCGVETIKD